MARRRNWIPYIFLIPAVAVMLVFVYIPVIENFIFSLYRWSALNPVWHFVGLSNYGKLFQDSIFWHSLLNNVFYAVISVGIQVFGALVLAAMLEADVFPTYVSSFFRTALFLPSVLTITVIGFTWQLIYSPSIGLANQLLSSLGLGGLTHAWIGNQSTAIFAIIGVSQWQWTGYIMVLLIVAIQAIPAELYEAARIDGANGIQQFFHVTAPGVRETTLVMLVITVIGAFKVFDIVWVMTQGGPSHASEVLGTYLYSSGFRNDAMGYASSIATIIFVITLILSFVQLRVGGTEGLA